MDAPSEIHAPVIEAFVEPDRVAPCHTRKCSGHVIGIQDLDAPTSSCQGSLAQDSHAQSSAMLEDTLFSPQTRTPVLIDAGLSCKPLESPGHLPQHTIDNLSTPYFNVDVTVKSAVQVSFSGSAPADSIDSEAMRPDTVGAVAPADSSDSEAMRPDPAGLVAPVGNRRRARRFGTTYALTVLQISGGTLLQAAATGNSRVLVGILLGVLLLTVFLSIWMAMAAAAGRGRGGRARQRQVELLSALLSISLIVAFILHLVK